MDRLKPLLWLCVLAAAGPAQGEELQTLLDCMRANIPQTIQIKAVELVATDRGGGSRTLRGRMYGQRQDGLLRTMLSVQAPSDLSGAAYLLREREDRQDEMYMYVPALQRVRRITGDAVGGTLWGTDLAYGDLKQINNAYVSGGTELLAETTLNEQPVALLQLTPDADDSSQYTRVLVWVEPKTCVALQAEFYQGETVRKRWQVVPESLQQAGAYWYAADGTMHDIRQGTQTQLRVLGLVSDKDLAKRYFNPKTFYIGQ